MKFEIAQDEREKNTYVGNASHKMANVKLVNSM